MIPNEEISMTVKGDDSGQNDISACDFRLGSREIHAPYLDYVVEIGVNAPVFLFHW
jgi:hypothetical protein